MATIVLGAGDACTLFKKPFGEVVEGTTVITTNTAVIPAASRIGFLLNIDFTGVDPENMLTPAFSLLIEGSFDNVLYFPLFTVEPQNTIWEQPVGLQDNPNVFESFSDQYLARFIRVKESTIPPLSETGAWGNGVLSLSILAI